MYYLELFRLLLLAHIDLPTSEFQTHETLAATTSLLGYTYR